MTLSREQVMSAYRQRLSREWIALRIYRDLILKMNSADRRRYMQGHADGREARLAFTLADAFLSAKDGIAPTLCPECHVEMPHGWSGSACDACVAKACETLANP